MTAKVDSKEVGLGIGLILSKTFLDTEYLHYGFFDNGLQPEIRNLAAAQVRYAEFLKSHIPAGTKTILDVGCGSGRFALELKKAGYEVECVSPGTVLTEHASALLGPQVRLHNCRFEDLTTDRTFDLVLFSESFQYIPVELSLGGALQRLNPRGHILICDFFKTDPERQSLLGGGHDLELYRTVAARFPLDLVKEQDITAETAPTIDVVNRLSTDAILPIYQLGFRLLDDRYPWVARFVKWKYQKKIAKLENKHFSGKRTGENFRKYKKYLLQLYRVRPGAPQPA